MMQSPQRKSLRFIFYREGRKGTTQRAKRK